jgi:hypothetical protein
MHSRRNPCFEHQKCKFTEPGTYNVNTGVFEVKLAGTYTG